MSDDEDLGTVRWFGEAWNTTLCIAARKVPTPIGEPCLRCADPILAEDNGITMPYVQADGVTTAVFHLDCNLEGILGLVPTMKAERERRLARRTS